MHRRILRDVLPAVDAGDIFTLPRLQISQAWRGLVKNLQNQLVFYTYIRALSIFKAFYHVNPESVCMYDPSLVLLKFFRRQDFPLVLDLDTDSGVHWLAQKNVTDIYY